MNFINVISGLSQDTALYDLKDSFQITNCPEQANIDDHTLISKQYADDTYVGGGSGLQANKIQYPVSGVPTSSVVCSSGGIQFSTTGIINMQGSPSIPVLINDGISSSNPITVGQVQAGYIPKTQDIGLQAANRPVSVDIQANQKKIVDLLPGSVEGDVVEYLQMTEADATVLQASKDYIDAQVAAIPNDYLPDISTLQDIFVANPSSLDLAAQPFKSTFIASSSNDLVNLVTTQALDIAATTNAINVSKQYTDDGIAAKNFIEFLNIGVTQSRVQCGLNSMTLSPQDNSLTTQDLLIDCSNLPVSTSATSCVRFSNPSNTSSLFLDIKTLCRDPTEVGQVANKLYVDGKMPGSASLQDIYTLIPSSLDLGSDPVYSSSVPSFDNQLTSKMYVDDLFDAVPVDFLPDTSSLASIATMNPSLANIDCSGQKLTGVGVPVDLTDAARKEETDQAVLDANDYTDTQISGLSLQTLFDYNPTDLSIGSQRILTTAAPISADDLANKAYVDSVAGGGAVGSLQSVYTNTPSDLDLSTNIFSSDHVATTARQIPTWGQTYNVIQGALTGALDTVYIAPNSLSLTQQGIANIQVYRQAGNETVFQCNERLRTRVPVLYTIQGSTNQSSLTFSDSTRNMIFAVGGSSEFSTNGLTHINVLGNVSRGSITCSEGSTIVNTNGAASLAVYDDGAGSGVVRMNMNGSQQPLCYFGVDGGDLSTQSLQIGSATDTVSARMKFYYNGFIDPQSGKKISMNDYVTYTFGTSAEILNNNDFCMISKGALKNYLNTLEPVGRIQAFVTPWNNASSLLPGWLPCNGTGFSSGTYPLLYAALGNVANTPDLSGRYLRTADNSGDTTFRQVAASNQAHTHDLSTGTVVVGAHTHTAGTYATVAGTTGSTSLSLSFSRSNQSGVTTPCLNSLQWGPGLNVLISNSHTHAVPSTTLTGSSGSTQPTGTISGNSGSQGSVLEVASTVVWYYVSTGVFP